MPQTLAVADAVELAVVERSGFVESRHAGTAIVLAPDGSTVRALGDVSAPLLPRSSLKPLQALACLVSGADLEGERLGLATASHSGTDRHVAVVRDILDSAGLDERALGCPPAWPGDQATRDRMVRDGEEPTRLRMNCSGKHAAMLLACVASGWDTATYLDTAHPLQVKVRETVERLTGERATATAIDGCGAPVFSVTLSGLARAMHRVGTAGAASPFALHRHAARLVEAVRRDPWTVDGPGRPDTIVASALGVFAKGGAEGVMVMIAPDGTTVALKILDGSGRAASAVALRLLAGTGSLDEGRVAEVLEELPLAVTGGGHEVGAIRPTV